jgi:hypothetical protein
LKSRKAALAEALFANGAKTPFDIEITRPNQVWAMDITNIPMAWGFVYLAWIRTVPMYGPG